MFTDPTLIQNYRIPHSLAFPEIRDRDLTHTDYICEIRTALNCERGLTSAKRATVFDALDRLHERLREAEESRDVVVGQVKELKRQCQVRICSYVAGVL